MSGDLFIKARARESLESFVHRMATLLGLGHVERRESSSYVDEGYFVGTALSLRVTFARADEADLDGYDFWIHLRPIGAWVEDGSFVDGLADLLARRMTIAGDTVVRLPNADREGGRKVFYALDAAAKGQVVTTEREARSPARTVT